MIKKQYKIIGMDCESCAKMIELDLEDAGIISRCDFAKKTLEVNAGEGKIKVGDIKDILSKSGCKIADKS
jgi:copper chaperone CopZ